MTAKVPYADGKEPTERRWFETDFAALEKRVLATMFAIDPAKGEDKTVTTTIESGRVKSITYDDIALMFEDQSKIKREQDEKMIEALMGLGMTVQISEALPDGKMMAILPKDMQRAYDAVVAKLRRQAAQSHGYNLFYGSKPAWLRPDFA